MKSFIAALLILFSSASWAMDENDVFVTENDAGGMIYLLPDECPIQGSKGAKVSVTVYNQYFVVGCWFFYDEKIFVLWLPENGEPVKSQYDPEIFVLEKNL